MCGSGQSKTVLYDKSLRCIEIPKELTNKAVLHDASLNYFEQAIRAHSKTDYTFDTDNKKREYFSSDTVQESVSSKLKQFSRSQPNQVLNSVTKGNTVLLEVYALISPNQLQSAEKADQTNNETCLKFDIAPELVSDSEESKTGSNLITDFDQSDMYSVLGASIWENKVCKSQEIQQIPITQPKNPDAFYFHNTQAAISFIRYQSSGIYWQLPVIGPGGLQLHAEELALKDIAQGTLTNDYFINAVMAICLRSDILKKNILTEYDDQKLSKVGFRLNIQGKWTKIWVNLKLPFYLKEFDKPDNPKKKDYRIKHLGAPNQNQTAWLCYLEKCYAKAMEGYFNISLLGESSHALTDLTGAPTKIIDLQSFGQKIESQSSQSEKKEDIWKQLDLATKKGRIICASTVSDEQAALCYPEQLSEFTQKNIEERKKTKTEFLGKNYDNFMTQKLGLVDKHNYAIISCKQLSNGTRLLLVRHIWEIYQWQGQWGLNHEIWRQDVIPKEEKKELKQMLNDRQAFFIQFEDFLNLFNEVNISCYRNKHVVTSSRLKTKSGRISVFNIEIKKAGNYSVRVSQQSHQLIGLERLKNQNSQYPVVRLALLKDNQVSIKLEGAVCDARRDVFIEAQLGIGIYCAYVSMAFW